MKQKKDEGLLQMLYSIFEGPQEKLRRKSPEQPQDDMVRCKGKHELEINGFIFPLPGNYSAMEGPNFSVHVCR